MGVLRHVLTPIDCVVGVYLLPVVPNSQWPLFLTLQLSLSSSPVHDQGSISSSRGRGIKSDSVVPIVIVYIYMYVCVTCTLSEHSRYVYVKWPKAYNSFVVSESSTIPVDAL